LHLGGDPPSSYLSSSSREVERWEDEGCQGISGVRKINYVQVKRRNGLGMARIEGSKNGNKGMGGNFASVVGYPEGRRREGRSARSITWEGSCRIPEG